MAKYKNYKSMSKKLQKRKVARTNTKLLTLVVVIIGIIIFGLGGLWYFVEYRGAQRNIKSGNTYFAAGEYKNARKQYGRAVTKEPTNLEYIDKLQEAILASVPVTPAEARAAYNEYVRTLIHKARYNPLDINSHLTVADEMYTSAFLTGLDENWGKLQTFAQNGLDQIELDNPRRHELLLYRGLSSLRIEDASMTDAYDDDANVRFPGESDFEEVLNQDPGNAMAWAALAHGRMAVYYRLNDEGRTKQATKNRIFAYDTLEKAMEVAGGSFEVSAIVLREMLLRRTALLQRKVANTASVTQEQIDAVTQKIVDARNKLVESYDPALHFARAGEMATLVSATNQEGNEVAVELLQATVAEHPDDFGRQYMLSDILVELKREDEAIEISNFVLATENQTVGLHAIELFSIRPLFAQLLVRIYIDKSQATEEEVERLALIDEAKKYRKELHNLVSGKEDNQLLLYSDGIIALAEKNYSEAAAKLKESIDLNPNSNPRVYRQAAFALAKINAKGLAIDYLKIVIEKQPSNLANYLAKAQLEIQLSDNQAAALTLSVLPSDTREREDVQGLLNLIALQRAESDGTAFSDLALRYIAKSEQLSKSKEFEEAISVLKDAVALAPEPDWRLFVATSNVYYKMDEKELAIEWLEKAIALIPNPDALMPQLHILQTNNRIDALISLSDAQDGTDAQKAEELAVSLYELGINYLGEAKRWAQMGNTQEAKDAKGTSDLAIEESDKYQTLAESLGADMTRIISLRFNQAITDKDLDLAESHLELLIEKNAEQSKISGSRISLHLSRATEAKEYGKLEVFNSHTSKALTIAEKWVEEDGISDFAWRALGRVLVEMGELEEAINAYAEAYRISPKNKQNIRRYVSVLAFQNTENQRLLRVLRLANDQYPADRQIRSAWLEAERRFGELWKVFVSRMNQNLLVPGDRTNALELAYLLLNTEPQRDLMRNLKGEEIYSARAWEQMPPQIQKSELRNARQSWDKEINQILESASGQVDPNIRIAGLHASIHRDLGQLNRSSEIWDRYIASVKETKEYTSAVIAAADFLHKSGRSQQSVQLLEAAREAQSDRYEIDAELGTLHLVGGQFRKAAEYFRVSAEATKDNVLQSRLIESLALSGEFEEAEKALEEYTTTNTAYAKAMLKALINRVKSEQLLAQGDIVGGTAELNTYRNALRDAITADPRSPVPYIQLCRSLLNEYRLTQRKVLLQEALLVADEASATGTQTEQFCSCSRGCVAGGRSIQSIY